MRTANRVLLPLGEFACASEADLYEGVHALAWTDWLTPEMTLAVDASVRDSVLTHSRYVALKTKDAIVDRIRDARGARPSVDAARPSVRVHVRLFRNRCTVSVDAAGTSLHERGYRMAGGPAPLKETLAAALVLLSGWQPTQPLLNPMCGSGTIAIEAALGAAEVAPGLLGGGQRRFGCESWRDFRPDLWRSVRREAEARRAAAAARRPRASVWASDRDVRALAATRKNARAAGVADRLHIARCALDDLRPPTGQPAGVLIMNPPYGERLGERAQLAPLYTALGDLLKHHFAGWTAYVLSGAPTLAKSIGLRTSRRIALWNGPIECRLLRYALY